jgi:hypothetical protein
MSGVAVACKKIGVGYASRYIKPRWILNSGISTEAFNLRDGPPPEKYVSHFMADGESNSEIFRHAYQIISKKIDRCIVGGIAILDVLEALEEVNDEDELLIEFIEQGLPHCGLSFLSKNQQSIQEAKATLCVLAQSKLMMSRQIAAEIGILSADKKLA